MELAQRFWSKVEKTDGCWIWVGTRSGNGYGHIWFRGRNRQAHRISLYLHTGDEKWLEGREPLACHKCDVPLCVRPDHLVEATGSWNMQDAYDKGRKVGFRKGMEHPKAKITDQRVVEIFGMADSGMNQREIASVVGIGKSCISRILNRKSWSHVALEL